jgi:hypothetical protein
MTLIEHFVSSICWWGFQQKFFGDLKYQVQYGSIVVLRLFLCPICLGKVRFCTLSVSQTLKSCTETFLIHGGEPEALHGLCCM